jgi:hypothetical protein
MEPSGRNQWQPVANGGASQTAETKPKPLPPVATSCRSDRMVRRGSPVRVRKRELDRKAPQNARLFFCLVPNLWPTTRLGDGSWHQVRLWDLRAADEVTRWPTVATICSTRSRALRSEDDSLVLELVRGYHRAWTSKKFERAVPSSTLATVGATLASSFRLQLVGLDHGKGSPAATSSPGRFKPQIVSGASRSARDLRTLSCTSGDRSRRLLNARSVRTSARTGDVVVTVAVRGTFKMRAISPKLSALPREESFRPFCLTSTVPSIKMKNSRPRSPSLIKVSPSGKSISSTSEAISPSCRFEQLENSGTPRISSTLEFLRSMIPASYYSFFNRIPAFMCSSPGSRHRGRRDLRM